LDTNAKGKRVQKKKTIKVTDPALIRAPKRLENYLDTELRRFEIEVQAGTYVRLEKMTFEAFVEQWIKKFVNVDLEAKTQDNYIYHTQRRIIPYFGHMHLDQIKTMHITDYIDYLRTPEARNDGKGKPLGSATLVYNYRVLRSIFTKAVEWRVIKDNPMRGVSKPKEDDIREMEVYDEREIAAMIQALEGGYSSC
jgi:integrase